MISVQGAVWFVLYVLGAGVIFSLLLYLVNYVCSQFPMMEPFAKFARIGLVVLAILVCIGIVLTLMGYPVIRLQ